MLLGVLLLAACQSGTQDTTPQTSSHPTTNPTFRLRKTFRLADSIHTLAAADLNNDGFPELLAAGDSALFFWENKRMFSFRRHSVQDSASCALNVMDFNYDSYVDIFSPPLVWFNNRDFTFSDSLLPAFSADCPQNPYFVDLNQDGAIDIAANGKAWRHEGDTFMLLESDTILQKSAFKQSILLNKQPETLALSDGEPTALGFRVFGADITQLIPADLDRDGDPDILSLHTGKTLKIWENQTLPQTDRHYIKLRLIGAYPNYYGIGARVNVRQNGQGYQLENQPRSALGVREPILYIGLGEEETLDYLTVHWPDGRVQRFQGLYADQELTVNQTHAKANTK